MTLDAQYSTGSQGLSVPNAAPDFLVKLSFDGKLDGHTTHIDIGGLMREFRNYAPFEGNGVSGHNYGFGVGGNINATFDLAKGYRLVLNAFAGSGASRYIGGLVPDVIVRANGQISPIKSYSWVSGLEVGPSTRTGFYVYYSGLYGQRNVALDTDGTFHRLGFPRGIERCRSQCSGNQPGLFSYILETRESRIGTVGSSIRLRLPAPLGRRNWPKQRTDPHGSRTDSLQLTLAAPAHLGFRSTPLQYLRLGFLVPFRIDNGRQGIQPAEKCDNLPYMIVGHRFIVVPLPVPG